MSIPNTFPFKTQNALKPSSRLTTRHGTAGRTLPPQLLTSDTIIFQYKILYMCDLHQFKTDWIDENYLLTKARVLVKTGASISTYEKRMIRRKVFLTSQNHLVIKEKVIHD